MVPFEFILRLRGFPITRAAATLMAFQRLSLSERESWIESKKWDIFKYHAEHNPMYRTLLGTHQPDQWANVPILRKADLQKPIKSMLSDSYKTSNVYVSNTSGSSGHPFSFARDKFTHALVWAYILDNYVLLRFDHENVAIYFALIGIGGGLGLIASYKIEKRDLLDKNQL